MEIKNIGLLYKKLLCGFEKIDVPDQLKNDSFVKKSVEKLTHKWFHIEKLEKDQETYNSSICEYLLVRWPQNKKVSY